MVGILLLILVSACHQQNSLPNSESPLEVVDLQISPTLEHWLPQIADCADDVPDFGIYTRVLPFSESESNPSDLLIRLGPRMENEMHVVVLGSETLAVIAGNEIPLTSLGIESLQNIYTEEYTNWSQVPEIIEQGVNNNQPIQILSYPDEHRLRILFMKIFLEDTAITSQPLLFSTPERLAQIIEEEPFAIGYLLESQAPDNAKILTITGLDPQAAQQLVLAVTPQEPQGKLRQFLLCLQNSTP